MLSQPLWNTNSNLPGSAGLFGASGSLNQPVGGVLPAVPGNATPAGVQNALPSAGGSSVEALLVQVITSVLMLLGLMLGRFGQSLKGQSRLGTSGAASAAAESHGNTVDSQAKTSAEPASTAKTATTMQSRSDTDKNKRSTGKPRRVKESESQKSQKFVSPLPKQYLKKPSTSGDFGDRHAPTAGASTYHRGNDFGAPEGTPLTAVSDGTIRVIPNNGGAGNTVEIHHANGVVTKYFHLSRFGKLKSGKIKQGQVLGYVGTTGTSTGPHLHFEVHKNGNAVDPWPYLSHLL